MLVQGGSAALHSKLQRLSICQNRPRERRKSPAISPKSLQGIGGVRFVSRPGRTKCGAGGPHRGALWYNLSTISTIGLKSAAADNLLFDILVVNELCGLAYSPAKSCAAGGLYSRSYQKAELPTVGVARMLPRSKVLRGQDAAL